MLFFSQLINELLFDYSIPSNRISTLNSHYLCLDALRTIKSIETKGVHEGSLKPIAEELFSELEKDPVFKDRDHPKDYFVKNQKGKYVKTGNVQELGYNDLKPTISVINELFFRNDYYFEELKNSIVRIIKDNKEDEQQCLFRLTKSLLTELTNKGYSTRYIDMVMRKLFWDEENTIESTTVIDSFFEFFDLEKKEYTVIYKVDKERINKFLSYVNKACDETIPEEYRTVIRCDDDFLETKTNEGYLCLNARALDPFAAEDICTESYVLNSSVYRLYDHTYNYRIDAEKCYIVDDKHSYKNIGKIAAIEHITMLSDKQIAESMEIVGYAISTRNATYSDKQNILNSMRYHAHAMDSKSLENQLLDFWAIFESILDISNKHTTDRINQICLYLVPILKQNYIKSLFLQLSKDIKNYSEDIYKSITIGAESDAEELVKVCEFTLLEENQIKRTTILDACSDFPLLQERVRYYQNALSSPAKVYDFVEKHADRVRWQIMRIYRNRNLIIHNGKRMPYLPLLIENLHSYVDDFLAYTIQSLAEGKTVEGMCQELFAKECRWRASFQGKKGAITKEEVSYMLAM